MRTLRRGWPTPSQYKADIARKGEQRSTARIAKELGVTAAGLMWLSRAVAARDGHTTQRGNEATRLVRDGYAQETGKEYRSGTYVGEIRYVTITDAGREIVRQARALGW